MLLSPEIDISRCEIVEHFVVALVAIVLNKSGNSLLQLSGEIMVFQADHVLERAMPALNLALGYGMVGCAAP